MAQSIYVTLETLKTETSVPEVKDKDGKILRRNYGSVEHTLPRTNYPTPEIFDNEELFVTWARERNALLAILQAGIGAYLIDDRAIFKAMQKGSWSPEIGQANVDKRTFETCKRPEAAKSKEQKAIEAISQLSPESLAAILAQMQKR